MDQLDSLFDMVIVELASELGIKSHQARMLFEEFYDIAVSSLTEGMTPEEAAFEVATTWRHS